MQITDQTRRILSGRPDKKGYREIRSDYLELTKEDALDPIANIAAGIRWLAHKRTKIPKGNEATASNIIKNYHSWDKEGEKYAEKVLDLYSKSKK